MRSWIRRPLSQVLVAAAIAATAVGGIAVIDGPDNPPPGDGLANLWWDADGGSCTRSSTAIAYNDATACAVPARVGGAGETASMVGWSTAQSGDTIGVYDEPGGNDYGVLTTGADGKVVTIKGMGGAGGVPEFSEAVLACDACTIQNVRFENRTPSRSADNDWMCQGPAPNYGGLSSFFANGIVNICSSVVLEDFEIDGLLNGGTCREGIKWEATGATIRNGSIHGVVDRKGIDLNGANTTLDGIDFYDIKRLQQCGGSDPHNECIYTAGGYDNLKILRSQFRGCPSGQGIAMLGTCGGSGPKNILIAGNVFARTNEGSGADLRNDWHPNGGIRSLFIGGSSCTIDNTWRVIHNTFETIPDADDNDGAGNGTGDGIWANNLGGADCSSRWAFTNNVGETCGGTGVSISPNTNTQASPNRMSAWYTDAFNWNFRPLDGSAPCGAASPTYVDSAYGTLTDIDGNVRSTTAPTAGAYEC